MEASRDVTACKGWIGAYMKCKQCNNEYKAKRSTSKYCSAKCRKLAFQVDAKVSVPANKPVSVPSLEQCRYCGRSLPALSRPRQYPGACYQCSIEQPGKGQPPATDGHTASSMPALHTDHKLTVMERLFYRPGQRNFVSLPGRACYGVYEGGA